MAKKKFSLADRKLGKVKRIIKGSGMLELVSGEKIPPFPNVEVGDEIEIRDKRYHVVDGDVAGQGKKDTVVDEKDNATLKKENEALKKEMKAQDERLKNLEAHLGSKGEQKVEKKDE